MSVKTKLEQYKSGCSQKTLKFLAKMTKNGQNYSRMDDGKESSKKAKKLKSEKKPEEKSKGKENDKTLANKEVREKKSKKKGWKRVRQAALTTCRYIGMGAVHMNPAALYAPPEYSIDPKTWNRSFSSSYKPKHNPPQPHWATNMMYSGY